MDTAMAASATNVVRTKALAANAVRNSTTRLPSSESAASYLFFFAVFLVAFFAGFFAVLAFIVLRPSLVPLDGAIDPTRVGTLAMW
jgi:hypothetical protein